MKVCGSHYCALMQTRFKLAGRRLLRRSPPTCALRASGRDESTAVRDTDWDKTDAWAQSWRLRLRVTCLKGMSSSSDPAKQTPVKVYSDHHSNLSKVKHFKKNGDEKIFKPKKEKEKEMITLSALCKHLCLLISALRRCRFLNGPLIWQTQTKTRWKCFLKHL